MKKALTYVLFCTLMGLSFTVKAQVVDSTTLLFNIDTVAKNLGYPWEITFGPDDSLWITESRGYRVLRVSTTRSQSKKDVAPQEILRIPLGTGEINFDRSSNRWPQGGMQGLAIHPEFMTDINKRWVYLSYVYKKQSCPNGSTGAPCVFRTKIVRCRFYFAADAGNPTSFPKRDTLTIMDTVISNLPGSNDHNSGRMTIGPVTEGPDNKYKLYYTIGDMGAGQFNNDTRTNYAQNTDTTEGKILRLNTEPDGDASFGVTHDYNTWRQWIPNDNPFSHSAPFAMLKTPVYSYGHRNAQGIVWGNVNGTWRLYSSEHGDKSDDEVNNILAGGNYGWPKVAGMGGDNNYSSLDAFPNNDQLASQDINYLENTWAVNNAMQRPLFVTFNWSASQIPSSSSGIFTWGTIAPSSIDIYQGNIPGWKNSLLVPSLKYGMYRLKLKSTGDFVDSSASTNTVDTFPLLHGWRIRDVAINSKDPNSGTLWVITDSTGSTSGPTGGFTGANTATKDGGKILRLTYKTLLTLPIRENTYLRPPVVDDLVSLYPNPATNILNVHGRRELSKPLLIQICDIYGRVLKQETSFKNDFTVDIQALKPGVYIFKLYNGNAVEIQVERFVKQ